MQRLSTHPVHLGPGGRASVEPVFDGFEWFDGYSRRHETDGANGWLVMQHAFDRSWTQWEMHSEGAEVVLCLKGRLTLIQEGEEKEPVVVALSAGDYAVNPQGVWHTADVEDGDSAVCLFITPGLETHHRPR